MDSSYVVIPRIVHDSGTVDEEHALHQGDVLPHLGLAGYGRHIAHLLLAQSVDHRTLARVRVADEAHADLLLVLVQLAELAQQLDESALAERVGQAGVEGECRMLLRQNRHPLLLFALIANYTMMIMA